MEGTKHNNFQVLNVGTEAGACIWWWWKYPT